MTTGTDKQIATAKEAWAFHKLLLVATLVGSAIFLLRYGMLLDAGQHIHFAEDFLAFYKAASVFDSWPPLSPYRYESDQLYFTGQSTGPYHPFLNAPFFLFLLWPLHFLTYEHALFAFIAAQLLLWFWVLSLRPVKCFWPPLSARPLCYAVTCFIITLPFAANSILSGQAGLFYASLLLLGMAILPLLPVRSGVLLALLTCKPPLALMVPVYLLAGRHYRALGAFLIMTAFLAVAATCLWSGAIWQQWLQALSLHAQMMQSPVMPEAFRVQTISLYTALRMMEAGVYFSMALQLLAAFVSVVLVAYIQQAKKPLALDFAMVALATLAANIYILQYDAVVIAAVILVLLSSGYQESHTILTRLALIIACFSAVIVPIFQASAIPLGSIILLLLFWQTCRLFKVN
jgi:hypothetical protein